VLSLLKARANFVIIDSAPLLAAIETRAIANAVDGTVLVALDGQITTRAIRRAKHYFEGRGDNGLLGLVFNRVDSPRSYGYYSYYSRYMPAQLQPERSQQKTSLLGKIFPFTRPQQGKTPTLTLAETADYLGVSQDMARRWCEQGRIQAKKRRGHWSVPQQDLDRFVADYQHEGNAGKQLEQPKAHASSSDATSSNRVERSSRPTGDSAGASVSS
jgi:excisionase family DNA binding protein